MLLKNYFSLIFILAISCLGAYKADGQGLSVFGHPGLIHTPSAYLSKWKQVSAGMTHYPAATSFTAEAGESPERSFWAHLGFLPFGEVSFRLTKPYNSQNKNYGIGDRSLSFRLQLLKEKKQLPAIVIGTNDPFSVSSFFNTTYIVLSKKFTVNPVIIAPSLGYGFKIGTARNYILQGLFGGVQVNWKQCRVMLEYDGEYTNMGIGYQLKELMSLNFALIDRQYFSGLVAFTFSLK